MKKLNENNTKLDIVTQFYQGDKAEKYEARRNSNPKWQFEDDALDFVLNQYKSEIKSIIDAPVGTGRFLNKYERLGDNVRVYGFDYSSDMLEIASGKSGIKRLDLIKQDLINQCININADLTVCYRFLNLIEWSSVVAVLKNLMSATQKYILFAIRTVDENYSGDTYIEDKIYLHSQENIEKLISENNFEVVKRFEFQDTRAGQYSIILCKRINNVLTCRINNNFRVVYTYGGKEPQGKIYQVKDVKHAQFIWQITNNFDIKEYFPKIKKINKNFVDVEWTTGELFDANKWDEVIDVLVKIQSLPYTYESSFDYVEDLVIPRFYNAHPIVGLELYTNIVLTIRDGAKKYDKKISHPDIIPGNVVITPKGFVVIDNELLCNTYHHRIDLLNLLYNCNQNHRNKILFKYQELSGISYKTLQNEQHYLSALWLARQVGSYIVKKNNVQMALEMVEAYKSSQNILPFDFNGNDL